MAEDLEQVYLWATEGGSVSGRVMMNLTDDPMTVWVPERRALAWESHHTPGKNAFSTLDTAIGGAIDYCEQQRRALEQRIQRLEQWREAVAAGRADPLGFGLFMEYEPADPRPPCEYGDGATVGGVCLYAGKHPSDFYLTAYPGRWPELHACFTHRNDLVCHLRELRPIARLPEATSAARAS